MVPTTMQVALITLAGLSLVLGLALAAALVALSRSRRRSGRRAAPAGFPVAGGDGVMDDRLRRVLDAMSEGFQLIGFDWRYRYINPAAAAHNRMAVTDLLGRTVMEAHPGVEHTEVFAALKRCMEQRAPGRLDTEFVFADGTRRWFQVIVAPAEEGIFILSVDITDRRALEEAIHHSEERHRALLKGLPESVFLLDRHGVYLDYHVPDPALLPAEPARFLGRPVGAVLPSSVASAITAAIERAGETGKAVTTEYRQVLTGVTRHFEAVVVPMDQDRVTLVTRDVTERRTLEAQLRQSQKMEAIGQLTGGIAHDFNNILTVISSNAELIAQDLPADAPAQQDLAELTEAVRRGAALIGQLLGFSRRGLLVRQPMNPAAVIGTFSAMLGRLLPESVRLVVSGDPDPGTVLLDTGALEQILANLCTNARDAMPEGGALRIECQPAWLDEGYHATHPWVAPGAYVRVSVADSGQGMDAETRAKVFEPFFTTKAAGAGTGLGMAMVYGLMKQHSGMVHIYSEPGQGTTVNLYFPVVEGQAATAPPRARRSDPTRVAGGSETLLLVEDEIGIRRASRRALEQKGYLTLEAGDGEEALEVYRRHRDRVSLIISDLVMPHLGGRQLAEALRAEGATVPILFTSGYPRDGDERDAGLPPGVSFLHKPWTLADLFTRVRQLLDEENER